jgi:riboflavin synthase
MFTGIVTHVGRIEAVEKRGRGARISVAPAGIRYRAGESVCVSGVCLTARESSRRFSADLSSETLRRSTFPRLAAGDQVNLERALRWGDRLSGHFVMGHVDAISRLVSIRSAGNSWEFRFEVPRGLGRLIAEKGSVALDGVSLTVAGRRGGVFTVSVIPETFRKTTLGMRRPGDHVNVEADIFARYGRRGALRRLSSAPGR